MSRPSMASCNNRHATQPVSAMLNYAYVVLESQVRIALVSQGLDFTVGYLHACRPGWVALVYDLMEPLRPRDDPLALDFLRSHTFYPTHFVLSTNGVNRLHPQFAGKTTTRLALNNAVMQEVVVWLTKELRAIGDRENIEYEGALSTSVGRIL